MTTPWLAHVLARLSHRTSSTHRPRFRPWPDVSRLITGKLALERLEDRTAPAIFTVTNIDDSGLGTLRQAILDANTTAGADTIQFAIGSGAKTITPTSALPTVTDAVTIDGTTQPSYVGVPIIELSGADAGNSYGLVVYASNSTIKGLVINRWGASGVLIADGATGNLVQGNYIGTDPSGTLDRGNTRYGIDVSRASNNVVTANLISGNEDFGVIISSGGVAGSTTGNVVSGNTIGLNAAGTAALANTGGGVFIEGGATDTVVGGFTATAGTGAGNVISGNAGAGVYIQGGGTDRTLVRGNLIGLGADGTTDLGNSGGGVDIVGSGTGPFDSLIGGDDAADGAADGQILARNVISGNSSGGIGLSTSGSKVRTVIQGNFIGTNRAGTAAVPNSTGVSIGNAPGTLVGGTTAGAGNVISGNSRYGVLISVGNGNATVQGNFIGTNPAGTAALPNGQAGVRLETANNLIGGTVPEARNVISGNTGAGVHVAGTGATGNTVAGNFIGVGSDGTTDLGNGSSGVLIDDVASGNTIGGSAVGAGNLISGNSADYGIRVDGLGAGNQVIGNYVGVDATGNARLANAGGVAVTAPNTTVRGNVLSGNAGQGISYAAAGGVIAGNTIGLGVDGSTVVGNDFNGVYVTSSTGTLLIGGTTAADRNVISGNATFGIIASPGAGSGTITVQGNYVGTDTTGLLDRGNGGIGIYVSGDAFTYTIGGLTDEPGTGVGNLVAGNAASAIIAAAAGAIIQGNLVGLKAGGAAVLRNDGYGVLVVGPNVLLGGADARARNVVSGNLQGGINLDGAVTTSATVVGNYVGTDLTGAVALGNGGSGVLVSGGASTNTIGGTTAGAGNVISGNTSAGVYLFAGTSGNTVAGNLIGTTAAGTAKLANAHGVIVASSANTVSGNVISGNTTYGVYLPGGATGNTIAGNLIGTKADGAAALANNYGVRIESGASGNTVGGTAVATRNLISGNTSAGVHLTGTGTSGNTILGNFIGTNDAGTGAVANPYGVLIEGGAANNTVGGTAAGARNLISGNANAGVYVAGVGTTGNTILGNYIGTKADGEAALPNGLGVWLSAVAGNTVGGPTADAGNVISGNTGDGVYLSGSTLPANTVSWWRAESNANDSVGANHATPQGGATFADGVGGGQAFDLNGTTAYVTVGDPANGSLDFGTGNFSYDFWVRPRAYGSILLNKGSHAGLPAGSRNGFFVYLELGGRLSVELSSWDTNGQFGRFTTTAGIPLNAWSHIAVVRTATAVIVYFDGVPQAGTNQFSPMSQVTNVSSNAPLRIGARDEGAIGNLVAFANGRLDELAAYSRALTAVEIVAIHQIGGPAKGRNVVQGNFIGSDATGSVDLGNQSDGIEVNDSAGHLIAGNLLSGNDQNGVNLTGAGTVGVRIEGNFIGTDASGTLDLGNGIEGINVINVSNVTIGGSAAGAGNVISGNDAHGVYFSGSSGNILAGNLIGTDADGTAALGNGGFGVVLRDGSSFNRIGTDADGLNDAAERNIISGNLLSGVVLDAGASGNTIAGNYIGTDTNGNTLIPGTVSWWKGEGNAADSVDGNTGTLVNGATYAPGKVGQAFSFDGTDDYVQAPTAGLPTAASDRTLELWVRLDALTAQATFAGYGTFGSAGQVYSLGAVSDGRVFFSQWGDAIFGPVLQTGRWYHVAATNVGSAVTLYLDGVAVGSKSMTLNTPAGTSFFVGRIPTLVASQPLDGQVDEVGVYNRALTAAEVQAIFASNGAVKVRDLGNKSHGIQVAAGSTNNTIGGTSTAARNVISGNVADGVNIASDLTAYGPPLTVDFAGDTNPGRLLVGSVSGAADLSARVSTAYTDTLLIVAVQVTDDFIDAQTTDAATPYWNDAVELFIDADRTSDDFVPPARSGSAEGFQLVADTLGNKLTNGVGLTNAGWTVFSRAVAGGYVIEFQLPLAMLDTLTGPGAVPAGPGSNLRLNLAIVDNDALVSAQQTYGILWRDGTTQPFATGEPAWVVDLVLDGGTPVPSSAPLTLTARRAGNTVRGNYIGTDPTGVRDLGNKGDGIEVNNSPGILIAGNLISGNTGHGVNLTGAGTVGARVEGNLIGTNAAGDAAIGNAFGVQVSGGASNNRIGTNGDGANDAAERNVISGNASGGVRVTQAGTSNTVIAGNYIGTNALGTAAVANAGNGGVIVTSGADDTRIGTNADGVADAAERNVISGNVQEAIQVETHGTDRTVIAGNYIGTNAAGTAAVGNGFSGILVWAGADGTRIGTDGSGPNDAAERNVISGNASSGVTIDGAGTTNTVVAGNFVGTTAAGTAALANLQRGVLVSGGAAGTRIGTDGDGAGDLAERNVISGNGTENVWIDGAGTDDTVIAGNYVGTNAAGTAAITNGFGAGMAVNNGPLRTRIGTNADGLSDDLERNVISGNKAEGLFIAGATTQLTVVAGNYFGLNAAGTAAVPNLTVGIQLRTQTTNNRIGSTGGGANDAARRNVISGNSGHGVLVTGAGTTGNVVAGNYIGTNPAGTAALANGGDGVRVEGGAQNNTIGGALTPLRAFYPLDANAKDASYNGAAGTLSPNPPAFGSPGYEGGALQLNAAVNNFVTAPVNINPSVMPLLSMGGWFKASSVVTSTSAIRGILSADNGGFDRTLDVDTRGGSGLRWSAFTGAGVLGGSPVVAGQWTFVAVRYNQVTGQIVLDVDGDRFTATGKPGSSAPTTTIGRNPNFDLPFDGQIDNVFIYSAFLSDAEIALIRGAGSAAVLGDPAQQAPNVISGNGGNGVTITGTGTAGNVVRGNHIGVNAAGNAALGNSGQGVTVSSGAAANWIGTDGNGVGDAGERNVIAGNGSFGVLVVGAGSNANVVAGNFIGVNDAGTAKLENGQQGVLVFGGPLDTRIGTDGSNDAFNAAERNVISGNHWEGIVVAGVGTNRTVIAGNYIGTNATGDAAIANGVHGISVRYGVQDTRVGTDGNGVADDAERNVISGNTNSGIVVQTPEWDGTPPAGGVPTARTIVAGNYIGTNAAGTAAVANGNAGVLVQLGAVDTRIGTDGNGSGDVAERNLISGNGGIGLYITDAATTGNVAAGNFIGLNAAGTAAVPNATYGIVIQNSAKLNRIGTDGNGVADAAERNVISGNTFDGIHVADSAAQNTIAGNYIGTDVTGAIDLGNGGAGIFLTRSASANLIGVNPSGGDAFNAAERNVISGNGDGVALTNSAVGNRISGNYIGLNAAGTAALGNSGQNVYLTTQARLNVIGTNGDGVADADERNVISGSANQGVFISDAGTNSNVVAGNFIGTNAAGTAAVANGQNGVYIAAGATDNRIGTDASDDAFNAAERNLISGNKGSGVFINDGPGTERNVIAGNYIGVTPDGLSRLSNGQVGVYIGSARNRVGTDGSHGPRNAHERNVIVASVAGFGSIQLGSVHAVENVIAGNYLGSDANGAFALNNSNTSFFPDVFLHSGSSRNRIGTNGDGVADADERNLISAGAWGVLISGAGTNDNVVAGNYIGTDATGMNLIRFQNPAPVEDISGNWASGVRIVAGAKRNRIGTDGSNDAFNAAERNVISGNRRPSRTTAGYGVTVADPGTDDTIIAGNIIGLNAAGTAALPNSNHGIWISNGAQRTRVGTNADGLYDAEERNVISGNGGYGILIDGAGTALTVVAGNFIGADATGTKALGNTGGGVALVNAAANVVGGTTAGAGNVISGNAGNGVTATGNGTLPGGVSRFRADGTAADSIGVNNGTINGGTTFVPGVSGQAFNFDGTGYVQIPNNASLNPTQLTVAGWIKPVFAGRPTASFDFDTIVTKGTGTGIGFGLFVLMDPAAGYFQAPPGGAPLGTVSFYADISGVGQVLYSPAPLPNDGQYHHVAGTFDGVTMRMYIDGVLVASKTASGSIVNATVDAFIGGQPLAPAPHNKLSRAAIDDVLLANRALTATELAILYSARGAGTLGNRIQGNLIGTDATGSAALGNGGSGVRVDGGAGGQLVGGTAAGAGNLIAFNTGRGILFQGATTTGNTATHNRVFANAGGNIATLDGANPTAVTPDLRAVLTGATTRVIGTLAGAPSASYRLELYASDPAVAEAREFLAEIVVTATAAGTIPLDLVLPIGTLPVGGFTLLATRLDTGETSSLSASVPAALVVVDGAPASAVPEGIPLTFATRATDPGPGQSVAYEWRVRRGGQVVGEGDEAVFSFTPDDDGAYTLTLTVRTSTGQVDAIDPVPIAVSNTAPLVEFTSFPGSAPPGAPFDVLARVTDLGTADTFTYEWRVWRDGDPVTVSAPANPLQFAFTPMANGLYEVELAVRDDEGAVGTRRVAVLVEGQVPEAQVEIQTEGKEGATVHARAELSAVLAQDQLTFEWTATKNGVLYAESKGIGRPNFEFVPDDNGVYVVGLRLSTPFASFTAPTRSVVVENVIPEARIGFDANSDGLPDLTPPTLMAGTAVPFLGAARDVGTGDVHTFRWSILNAVTGQVVRQGVGRSLSFIPPTGGTYVVTLVAEDDDGGRSEVSTSIEVAALTLDVQIVLPTAFPNEGDALALNWSIANPPAGVGFHYQWEVRKDGEVVESHDSGTFTTTLAPIAFTPEDDGRYEISLSVRGSDGSTGERVEVLDVLNVAPAPTLAVETAAPLEGSPVTVTATANDPGLRDDLIYLWTVNGKMVEGATEKTLTFTPDDNGPYTVAVAVDDGDGGKGTSAGTTVEVANVRPNLAIATDPTTTAADGSVIGLRALVTDPGSRDTFTYDWRATRDGSVVKTQTGSSQEDRFFNFPKSGVGTYVVELTVTDNGGLSATTSTLVLTGTDAPNDKVITAADLGGLPAGTTVGQIVYSGLGGDDTVSVGADVLVPVVIDGGDGNDNLTGGGGGDLLFAGAGNNKLSGGLGNDTMVGGGNDTIDGGEGDDFTTVHFSNVVLTDTGGGIDTIDLSQVKVEEGITFDFRLQDGTVQTVFGTSTLAVSGSFEVLIGTGSGDSFWAASGTSLFGGGGDDELRIENGITNVTVFGGEGADIIEANAASNVTVFGGVGDDLIQLDKASAVTVFGGEGIDTIEATAAASVSVFGGEGADVVLVTGSNGVTVYGGAGNDKLSVDGGDGIAVFGGDAEGVLTPELDAITVFGGSGDDTIEVRAATNATVFGGDGVDAISVLSGSAITVFGGEGEDKLTVATPDGLVTVFGGEGDDELRVLAGAGKNITVFGGAGVDEIEVAAGSAVTVFGGEGADVVAVSGGTDVTVFGEGGDDVLSILGGIAITVFGGDGIDTIRVADGDAVTVFGGEGVDAIAVSGGREITVFGGEADDVIAVSGGMNVTVFGGLGDDEISLTGGGVNITVFGGEGDDTITAAAATAVGVTVFGGEANDTIFVTAGNGVTVFGGEGDDALTVAAPTGRAITVFGGDGADLLTVTAGAQVTVFGGADDDTIRVTGGIEVTVFGGEGNDRLTADVLTGSNITLFGEGGDDKLFVSAGNGVTVFGGVGDDLIRVEGKAGQDITVFGGDGADDIAVSAGTQVTVFGGEGDDVVAVSDGTEVTVFGGGGIDTLTVSGGTGITVFGGEADDVIAVSGGMNVTVFGGEADDTITVTGGTAVTVFGGDGVDTIVVDAAAGKQITVFGGEGEDVITVSAGNGITVFGGEGDDALTVTGLAGKQITVFGGDGADVVEVSAGSQVTVFGEGGGDVVTVAGGSDITVFGGDGADVVVVEAGSLVTVFGEGGADVLTTAKSGGTQVNLFGGADADAIAVAAGSQVTVFGGSGDDTIRVEAAAGDDITVFGGSGDDLLIVTAGTGVTLLGERGNDDLSVVGVSNVTLFGGAGNDHLHGSGGIEISLYGDDGDDTYRVTADAARETRVRVKEIQTLGAGHEPGEKGTTSGSDHVDRPAFGAETLDLSAFHAITIDLTVLGTDLDPRIGWQTLTDLAGRTAVIVLHGFFENVIGTDGADLLTGNRFANRFDGRGGNDTLTGLEGDDVLEGGTGDDRLTGGTGSDTYVFAGTGLGSDLVIEEADRDSDTLDFAGLAGAVTVDLGSAAAQVQSDVTFTLSDGRGLENVVGSAGSDTIIGNDRDNVLEGGAGDDAMSGGAGADIYRYVGENLGTDTLTESGTDSDTLDFAGLLGGVSMDLTAATAQGSAGAGAFVAFADPTLFEGVIGTAFPDVIKGNGADNILIGGGGRDHLDGGAGNDVLRGGSGQVIHLDFPTAAEQDAEPWEWRYDDVQREAIRKNLADDFARFGYVVTLDRPTAGQFLTIVFNDDQAGGRSEGIDFRNTSLGGTATVNVNGLLDDLAAALLAAGVPQAVIDANWTRYVADLSAHVAGHEAGHSLGLRHGDAYGAIGTGVNTFAQSLRYLPALPWTDPGATETGWHLMSSPAAVGTSLADSARDTFLGLRESIKLAHADTGTTVREAAPGYNAHDTLVEAVDLGRFHGLSVPNTLRRDADPFFNKSLSVAAVAVLGSIAGGAGLRSEDDVYAFAAAPGEWFHFEINSYVLGRVGNPIDSILRVYDAAGKLLAFNDDEFETPDAVILDWRTEVAGTYYVVVDTFTPDGIRDFDTGAYELFAYRIAVGPDLGLGDTIVTGAGTDTVFTSAAKDTVQVSAGSVTKVFAYSFALPLVENLAGSKVDAFDATGGTTPEPLPVPVKTVNDAPELNPVSLPADLIEGQSIAVVAGAFDKQAGMGDRLTYRLEAAPGETLPKGLAIDTATGELRWTPADNGTYRFRVVVSDTSGAEDFEDVTAVVANANPTATVTGPEQVKEGITATFGALGADAGVLDTLSYTWTVDGVARGTEPSFAFLPADNRGHTIAVTITDKDGGSVSVTRTLAVTNVAPVAAITSVTGVLVETGTVALTGTATDAGGPSAIAGRAWTVVLGGSLVATGTGDGVSFTAADDGDYVVTFTVTDKDGATHATNRTVQVTNAAPVAAPLPHLTLDEAVTAAFRGDFTDRNAADGPFAFLWRVTGPTGPGPDGSALTYSFLPPDAGEYEVLFKVTDKDGAAGVAIGRVSVTETAPKATFAQAGTTDEGSLATVAFTGMIDSPADLAAGLRYSFDLDGDGKYEIADAASPTAGRVFDESGTYTVRGKVADKDGKSTEYTTTITVRNVAPVVGLIAAPTAPVAVGALVEVSARFTDVGTRDTHTAVWNWGDGTFSDGVVTGLSVAGSHAYARAGVYTVTLTVRDDEGAEHQSFFRYVAVYDVEAGSLNGSGWFESPAGAYAPNPALTGKAQFGFVSRYGKDATEPSGQVSLRLRDFAFRSTTYEWMVISAPRGMLRGTGTVDGVAGYGFLVSGFDGQGSGVDDRVRIKVWHLTTGAVVYDNQPGAPDDAAPTIPIGAGNIIIIGGSNGLIGPSAVAGSAPALAESQLPALVAEALARWRAAGAAVDGLAGLPVRVADLPGGTLGLATPGGIWIDLDAAGRGWFVDPTPADDSEFRLPGDQGEAGLLDLLTVLLHEFGHLLGHDHEDDGLMGEALIPGMRLLPEHDHPARHEEEAPPHDEPTPRPVVERREDHPIARPTTAETTPTFTVRHPDPFAVSIAPWWSPEPAAPVSPTPAAKAAVRPAADDGSDPLAPRETGEETPEPAERVGPEVFEWIDWPDEWWGVPLEPERS